MTISEATELYPEATLTEIFEFTSPERKIHPDCTRFISDPVPDDIEVAFHSLMDEDTYNSTIKADSPIQADFDMEYGDPYAQVLVIILPEDWREKAGFSLPEALVKLGLAKKIIALDKWDGSRDPQVLCRLYSVHELSDILDIYESYSLVPKKEAPHDRYDRENTVRISLKLNKNTDREIIEWLFKQPSKQGAIKDALIYRIRTEK